MDLQYLLLLQKFRDATGGVLNDFFVQISDLSYGVFIWMLACVLFWSADKKTGAFLFPVAGVALAALFLAYISLKSYPMAYDEAGKLVVDPAKMMKDGYKDAGRILGVSLGWYLERRYVRFSTDVPVLTKVTRCGVGVLVLLLYELTFMPAVTGAVSAGWIGLVLTFGELIVLLVLYPLCFSRLEARRVPTAAANG